MQTLPTTNKINKILETQRIEHQKYTRKRRTLSQHLKQQVLCRPRLHCMGRATIQKTVLLFVNQNDDP